VADTGFETASPREQELRALLTSLEGNQEIRLTQKELPRILGLKALAYRYNPQTQIFCETN
jgi:hypothetical protein